MAISARNAIGEIINAAKWMINFTFSMLFTHSMSEVELRSQAWQGMPAIRALERRTVSSRPIWVT
jgi:hypothetical protein